MQGGDEQQQQQLSTTMAVTHLLQHTLRGLCTAEGSQWVYAVFWRILPRNYPPPNRWDLHGGAYDRTRGNRRNWILAWEDGYCNFAAAAACGEEEAAAQGGLQPELFFKMSHDIYNFGEGLIGKIAADHSHKWVLKERPLQDHEITDNHHNNHLSSSWSNCPEPQPRTWEAQFQCGIKTIALIAVREGVVQLGAMKKVTEDLTYVVHLRCKFGYLESIPGVLLPHPSAAAAAAYPISVNCAVMPDPTCWTGVPPTGAELYIEPFNPAVMCPQVAAAGPAGFMPSMSSLETLLSKLPSVAPPPPPITRVMAAAEQLPGMGMAKEEVLDDDDDDGSGRNSALAYYYVNTTG